MQSVFFCNVARELEPRLFEVVGGVSSSSMLTLGEWSGLEEDDEGGVVLSALGLEF